MTICLIIPPSPFLLDERVFLSLGVLKVAGSLEQAGHHVDVLDLSGVENYLDAVDDYVASHPDTNRYGLTATTPQMPAALKINDRLPWWAILGGPHATLVAAAARNEVKKGSPGRATAALNKLMDHFCVIVAGDGEKAIHLAIGEGAPTLIDADNPRTDLFLSHAGFTQSPWPARHLVDFDSYHYEIEGHKATSIIAQLGCPFGCNFCGGRLSPMLRQIRLRDTENIVAEMEHLYTKYGITGFMFYDDELNVNPKLIELMMAILALQRYHNVEFRLRGFVKAELFTALQAAVMHEAGFRWLLCGFESGSEKILRNINKKATRADNSRMLTLAHAAGIKVKALMSLGHPGESQETIADTTQWLLDNQPDELDCTVITVYPGTPYYDDARLIADEAYCFEVNRDRLYHWDIDFTEEQAYYKGAPGKYRSFVWTDHLMGEDLVAARDYLEETVREQLGLPYPTVGAAIRYDHSMGQGLPGTILRSSKQAKENIK